jgi:hypothetical protein
MASTNQCMSLAFDTEPIKSSFKRISMKRSSTKRIPKHDARGKKQALMSVGKRNSYAKNFNVGTAAPRAT